MSCTACQHDPALKEDWGCEEPTHSAVWVDEEDENEFFSCPILFIPSNVFGWYREYTYSKDFPGAALPYHLRSARWIDAYEMYTSAYARFMREAQKNRSSAGKEISDDDKARLKRHFADRRSNGTDG